MDGRISQVHKVSFEFMENFLTNPETRIVDSRIIENLHTWGYRFQVLKLNETILETEDTKDFPALELFKLQYRHNPRNNPGLYGLLDEKR